MEAQDEILRLRAAIADYEFKTRKTGWLLRQLGRKLRSFPGDLAMRLENSRRKRRDRARVDELMAQTRTESIAATAAESPETAPAAASTAAQRGLYFALHSEQSEAYFGALTADPAARRAQAQMESFFGSHQMSTLVAEAAAIDPEVGTLHGHEPSYLAPWHDGEYARFRAALRRILEGNFETVVLVPFGKLGGADLVAGLAASAFAERDRTLILRTDLGDWERPDWYPTQALAINLAEAFAGISDRPRALYWLLRRIGAKRVFNVNSRLGFDMFAEYGERLAVQSHLYAYYFCADRDPYGNEVGYPVWYFPKLLPHLKAAICDTVYLADTLARRYALDPELRARVVTLYTPARRMVTDQSAAALQVAARSQALMRRPRILWAGRLDRQKRFDIVIDLALKMPDIDFDAWGKAVLDPPPDLSSLPPNLRVHPPFAEYEELPLTDCDGWLYTADWDGLPTILIELGARGVPIVATAVGGVPELIDSATGWPVEAARGVNGHAEALRAMLADPDARISRAGALQQRVRERHLPGTYAEALTRIAP